jgi:hypothetical protein
MTKETHNDPMAKAVDIVQRYRARGLIMPREWRDHADDPVRAEVRTSSVCSALLSVCSAPSLSVTVTVCD